MTTTNILNNSGVSTVNSGPLVVGGSRSVGDGRPSKYLFIEWVAGGRSVADGRARLFGSMKERSPIVLTSDGS